MTQAVPEYCDAPIPDAPADAKTWDGVADKFATHFSANPGSGD